MSMNNSKKRRLKYLAVAAVLTASLSAMSFAAACTPKEEEDNPPPAKTKEDTQLLKNGNFEFFNVPEKEKDGNEPVYLINTPNNWTHGGTTSSAMSGIIDTNKSAWDKLSSDTLADALDANNALNSSDKDYKENYIDYNGMKSGDILYKDTYSAVNVKNIKSSDENGKTVYHLDDTEVYYNESNEQYYFDAEFTKPLKEQIKNPGTHYNIEGTESNYYYENEKKEKVPVYKNDAGDYFLDKEFKETFTNVLMLHNFSSSAHNGITQNYSSVSIDMPANTAAEISVWVKTSNLLFQQGTEVVQDRGAYISVSHTVGGTTLDDFTISCINTEKLLGGEEGEYNGWVEYTVYVKACDFASSTVSLKLGLGETNYLVEGYAFFDDIKVTKYIDLESEGCTYNANKNEIETAGKYPAQWSLTDDASDKIFKADTFKRNEGIAGSEVTEERFSKNFHYLLDLASGSDQNAYDFAKQNLKTGLTVDSDNYVSSKYTNTKTYGGITLNSLATGVKIPDALKNVKVDGNTGDGLDVSNDILGLIKAGAQFPTDFTEYHAQLNEALKNAAELPNGENSDVLVMLSARGAAYSSSFDIDVPKGEKKIVSFWVKTSDMNGSTAATVSITENGNKSNTTSFTLDTTNSKTAIDDEHTDIYNGWVQCFFFLSNTDEENDAKLTAEIKFGNTAFKDSAISAYKGGWVAVANVQTLDDVDKETFAYTSTGDHAVALTVTEDSEKKTTVFDEAYGSQANEIENGIVNPSTYSGVNGASSSILNNGAISIPYDDFNTNPNAGLINKEYFKNYAGSEWYKQLLKSFGLSETANPDDAWNTIFGSKSLQPLIIVNNERTVKVGEDDTTVMNYGFIGNSQTVAANSYSTVSVRVKVSKNAVAYIYLADTAAGKQVLSYKAPAYSYWYDEDGNVLMKEPDDDMTLTEKRENILYKLRTDGLYEDKDGKIFANTHNYEKSYKDQTKTYYSDKEGKNEVKFDKLSKTETYYYANGEVADHFLVNKDGDKIYEVSGGKRYYMVEGKRGTEVNPFTTDEQYLRYNNTYDNTTVIPEYVAVLDSTKDPSIADKWVTVNFVIHTGSESLSYRLELWSGERGEKYTDGNNAGGTVLFDHSYTSVSDDSLKNAYESEIINAYKQLLRANGQLSSLPTSTENIRYFENLVKGLVKEGKIAEADYKAIKDNYTAYYYSFSLYDQVGFKPFNQDKATEGTLGYEYTHGDYSETLSYLLFKDASGEDYTYNVLVDYSPIDVSVNFVAGSDDDDDDGDDEEETENNTNVWLLASSILLVVAMVFAIASILIRDMLKKKRRNKAFGKNNFDHSKANRYMRKLKIKQENIEEVEANGEEQKAEEAEQTVEEPAEEVPAEEPAEVEETEETVETEETTEEVTEEKPEDPQE